MVDIPKADVSDQVARHVLWLFDDTRLGEEPGHFTGALLRAMIHADRGNLHKLAQVYPDYVYAVHAVKNTRWGLDWLRKRILDQLPAAPIAQGPANWEADYSANGFVFCVNCGAKVVASASGHPWIHLAGRVECAVHQ